MFRKLLTSYSHSPKLYSALKKHLETSELFRLKGRHLRTLQQIEQPLKRASSSSEKRVEKDEEIDAEIQRDEEAKTKTSVKGLLENASIFDKDNEEEKEDGQRADDVWNAPVYPQGFNVERDQARHSFRPKKDPAQTSVLCFPGQGSQRVGMGSDLLSFPKVEKMYEIASDILKFDLLHLSVNGPKTQLNKTENCQVAIFVHSLATIEKIKATHPQAIENCVAAAGFSSGEYAALVFAGALSFQDGVKVLLSRGRAMQAASEMFPSGMMTIWTRPECKIKFTCHAAKEWAYKNGVEDPVCSVASYLYPECKVIAGNEEALDFVELNAQDLGIKRLKRLPVSGAFHTFLMKPAKGALGRALDRVQFCPPRIAVHSNLDGKTYSKSDSQSAIVERLLRQICNPVKWEQTLHIIYERTSETAFPKTFECGPGGQSLLAILKQTNLKAWQNSFQP